MEYEINHKEESPYSPSQSKTPNNRLIPFHHKELVKSLEAISTEPEKKIKPNALESMISDKAKSLKASVNALLEEINLRENLNKYQFKEIDDDLRRQRTRLMQYKNLEYEFSGGLNRTATEAKSQIESSVLELKKEKRKEGLECWRDLMFLKKYLMVSLRDYWELVRRREALEYKKEGI
tara:strand:+ start:1176 stop:1712 length:537 start_codon:yes stop_codon:yes gene_type:complete